MSRHLLLAAASAAFLASAGLSGAAAQTTGAPGQPVLQQPRDPNMPSVQNTVPEKIDGGGKADSTGSTQTLSDKLEATGGVITPPNTGPDIRVAPPAPEPNTTPIIPPGGVPAQPARP